MNATNNYRTVVAPMYYVIKLFGLGPFSLNKGDFKKSKFWILCSLILLIFLMVSIIMESGYHSNNHSFMVNMMVWMDITTSRFGVFSGIFFQCFYLNEILMEIDNINEFDICSARIFHINLQNEYKREKKAVHVILLLTITYTVLSVYYTYTSMKENNMISLGRFIVLSTPALINTCVILQFFVLVYSIKQRLSWLNKNLQNTINKINGVLPVSFNKKGRSSYAASVGVKQDKVLYALEITRRKHYKLCQIAHNMNKAFYVQIFSVLLQVFVTLTLCIVYGGRHLIMDRTISFSYVFYLLTQAILTSVQTMALVIICSVTSEEATRTGVLVHKVIPLMKKKTDSQLKKEIYLEKGGFVKSKMWTSWSIFMLIVLFTSVVVENYEEEEISSESFILDIVVWLDTHSSQAGVFSGIFFQYFYVNEILAEIKNLNEFDVCSFRTLHINLKLEYKRGRNAVIVIVLSTVIFTTLSLYFTYAMLDDNSLDGFKEFIILSLPAIICDISIMTEKHNFYTVLAPMYYLIKLFGLTPFSLNKDAFVKSKMWILWSLILSVALFTMSIVYDDYEDEWSTQWFMINVIHYLDRRSSQVGVFSGIFFQCFYINEILAEINNLNEFDLGSSSMLHINLQFEYKKERKAVIVILLATITVTTLSLYFTYITLEGDILEILKELIFLSSPAVINTCVIVQFFTIVYCIQQRFGWLNTNILNTVNVLSNLSENSYYGKKSPFYTGGVGVAQYKVLCAFEIVRRKHYKLCQIVYSLNKAFYIQILSVLFQNFITLTLSIFYCGVYLILFKPVIISYVFYALLQAILTNVQMLSLIIICSITSEEELLQLENPSGWCNEEKSFQCMKHFIEHVRPTKENPDESKVELSNEEQQQLTNYDEPELSHQSQNVPKEQKDDIVYWVSHDVFTAQYLENCSYQATRTGVLIHKILPLIKQNTNLQFKKELLLEVVFFSSQLFHQNIKFTAYKLFNVDETLLFTVVGSVASYLIIVLQFLISRPSSQNEY
ncbi:hypothetical protein FQR65_LT08867 [Abscondita terminalis]|nr:hypothetical protein FQR65_LT08867 [Abscondita terminalis]